MDFGEKILKSDLIDWLQQEALTRNPNTLVGYLGSLKKSDLFGLVEKIILASSYEDLARLFRMCKAYFTWIYPTIFPGICLEKMWQKDLEFFTTLVQTSAPHSKLKLPFFQKETIAGLVTYGMVDEYSDPRPNLRLFWVTISSYQNQNIYVQFDTVDDTCWNWCKKEQRIQSSFPVPT